MSNILYSIALITLISVILILFTGKNSYNHKKWKIKMTRKFIGAVLLGIAAGISLGILFAPDRGNEIRKRIAGKTNGLTNALIEFNTFMDESIKDSEIEKEQEGKKLSGSVY